MLETGLCYRISIHALLAESDRLPTALRTPHQRFLSTLSLRRATRGWTLNINGPIFLSTLSLRRATCCGCCARCRYWISIHALLAESDYLVNTYHRIFGISIHALLAESDSIFMLLLVSILSFLSTLSLRRATVSFA